jgi:hypothetical protein
MKYLIPLLFLAFLSCKKSNNDLASQRSSLLVDKKWQLTGYDQDWIGDNGTPVHFEQLSALPEFLLDDYVIFRADNTLEMNDNQILDPDDPIAVHHGNWHFEENGTVMVMEIDNGNTTKSNITSVTDAEWKQTKIVSGITNTYTFSVIP